MARSITGCQGNESPYHIWYHITSVSAFSIWQCDNCKTIISALGGLTRKEVDDGVDFRMKVGGPNDEQ